MKKKILQTIDKHNMLERGMYIIVGLSGGPDSVCLFDVLRDLASEMDWKLYAVHVNHKLRPGAAEEDQHYVEQLCKEAGVPCYVFEYDCNAIAAAEGMTSEEAGRKVRYEAFGQVAAELCDGTLGASSDASAAKNAAAEDFAAQTPIPKEKIAIALAHNANDQCETILFRLMRGTGIDGLAGIAYKRYDENGYAIVRPILDCMRSEIESYCEERNLSPRIDHTNSENLYARNRIRNMLIPYLQENFNENIIDVVNRLGKTAAEDRDFLRGEAQKAYKECLTAGTTALDCKCLQSLHKALRFRVYTIALSEAGGDESLTFAQGERIDAVLFSESPSAMCDLTGGARACRQYDRLVFYGEERSLSSKQKAWGEWRLREMTRAEFEQFQKASSPKPYGVFGGAEAKELCLRTRKEGDRINIGAGDKKLKDYFIDEKIPKLYRNQMLLLAKGSEILWILPSDGFTKEELRQRGRFSAKFKAFEGEADAIIVLEKL